ncbi:MAG: hypothetical protein IIT86_01620 [Oscillospiraceae bacterium]|nr:hypothetical protein [Lachnospiraceae bacterium]MBQ5521503.1 hypothetical protein [Oscillospiraceae bacterium]MBR3000145.1 hypothetical protein [Oscillospiraceae bacterium]
MTNSEYPRLSGGTFFILVLQALKQRKKAREHYKGERDGLSDPEVLMGLCKVINPDYREIEPKTIKGATNDFKACRTSTSTYFPFGDTAEVDAFDKRVKNNYPMALNDMIDFVNRFIDTGDAVGKDERLVKALVDLIDQDESIGNGEKLYVQVDGRPARKDVIKSFKKICLPAFLLGVWHYTVVNRKDNGVGQKTYDYWCPSNGNSPRPYRGHMGEGILSDIDVYQTQPTIEDESEDVILEPDVEEVFDEPETETAPKGATQIYNNPLIIQQNGDGNTVIPNYGTININKK